MENRTNRGTFKPGHSGNPSGRPKIAAEVRALAQEHSAEAIELLVEIMRNKNAAVTSRTAAANAILDRAIGRPEFSGKIETCQVNAEPNFENLTETEFALLERIHTDPEYVAILGKLTSGNGGTS